MSNIVRSHHLFCQCKRSMFVDGLQIGRHDFGKRCIHGNLIGYDTNGISFCENSSAIPVFIDDND